MKWLMFGLYALFLIIIWAFMRGATMERSDDRSPSQLGETPASTNPRLSRTKSRQSVTHDNDIGLIRH
jgi:hypothetical protein